MCGSTFAQYLFWKNGVMSLCFEDLINVFQATLKLFTVAQPFTKTHSFGLFWDVYVL